MIDTIFFDAAGTLLRLRAPFPQLVAETCRRHGADLEPATVGAVLQLLREEAGEAAPPEHPLRTLRELLQSLQVHDPALPRAVYDRLSASRSYTLFADVRPALEILAGRGYRLGVISNFEPWLPRLLRDLRVDAYFGFLIVSGLVGTRKPDAGIYRQALRRADVPPAAAVHVGDSYRHDLLPARRVGMRAVLVDRCDRGHPGTPGERIASLEELPQLLAELEVR